MYALKARDKLHKREKEERKEREKAVVRRSRDLDAYHRGETGHDPEVTAAGRRQPATTRREAKYIGTSSIEMRSGWQSDIGKSVKQQLSRTNTKNTTSSIPVVLLMNVEGVKVITADGQNLIMAHALKRIVFCTAETKKSLFALVARNPQTGMDGVYCHVFLLPSKEKASELSELVGKAFKAAFTKRTLKRDKKKKKQQPQRSPSPHPPPPIQQSQPWSVQRDPAPHLQVPPPSGVHGHNQHSSAMSSQPWSSGHNHSHGLHTNPAEQHRSGGGGVSVTPSAPSAPGIQSSNAQLLQEAGQLEGEILGLHAKVHQIENQLVMSGGNEQMALELTMQLSSYQQQLDEKGRRLISIQQGLHGTTSGVAVTYHGAEGGGGGVLASNRHSGSSLPDIDSISLDDAEWFQAGIPRELAMEVLSQQGEGTFIVRQSTSHPGFYALSLKAAQGKIVHYLIEVDINGVHLQGSTCTFPTLVSLILHHCVNQENLACTLNLGNSNPTFLEGDVPNSRDRADSDSDIDDDDYLAVHPYQLLSDS